MCDHIPIPHERLVTHPPETRPIVVEVGHKCLLCGQACERREPT